MIMLMMVSEMAFHTCDEIQAFKEAFDAFDWNKSGTISYKSLQVIYHFHFLLTGTRAAPFLTNLSK